MSYSMETVRTNDVDVATPSAAESPRLCVESASSRELYRHCQQTFVRRFFGADRVEAGNVLASP